MNRVPPEPLFDPSLLSLDNAAEEFWQEYKRKQEEMSLPETEAEAEKRFMECTERLKANHRDSDIFRLKQRSLVIGFLAGLIFGCALGLILWMVW